jgi:thiamine biosynthesis lipoprotein
MTTSLHHVEHVMGMAVSIDVRAPSPDEEAIRAVCEWLHHVDETFSTYKEHSEISRFARNELAIDDLSSEVTDVLLTCIELSDTTDGAFDAFAVPASNGTTLDPSGYVKGWAVEHASAILEGRGAQNFCINAGGDIAIRGEPSPGDEWRIGIRHPADADKLALALRARGPLAIATSATYERGAHIIDPRTGQPTTGLASATVVGPDLAIADAFATAAFVMGEDALDWIERQPGYDLYIVTHDDITRWSSGFPMPSAPTAPRQSQRSAPTRC